MAKDDIFPHPEIAPNNKFFLEKNGIWYCPVVQGTVKIDHTLEQSIRILVGAISIYYWNKMLAFSIDKPGIADIADELIECPPTRIITFHLMAWERWIEGGEIWNRFCTKTHKEAIPILERLERRRKRT